MHSITEQGDERIYVLLGRMMFNVGTFDNWESSSNKQIHRLSMLRECDYSGKTAFDFHKKNKTKQKTWYHSSDQVAVGQLFHKSARRLVWCHIQCITIVAAVDTDTVASTITSTNVTCRARM